MEKLEGRTAFITGGASGIGLSIAEALIAAGARVVLADIDEERLDRETARLGKQSTGVMLDVASRDSWSAARSIAMSRWGAIDILVNNAGIGPDGSFLADMEPASFDRLLTINLTGAFNGIRWFADDMRQRGEGHIVNTASMAGLIASQRLGAYTASKFAVVGLSEVLRAELAPFGVGVSVLCPGLVTTRLGETTLKAGSARIELPPSKVEGALDAAIVGDMVVEAIRTGAFYVVTHGEQRRWVAARMDEVLEAFDHAAGYTPSVAGTCP